MSSYTPGPWVIVAKTSEMTRVGPENQPMANGYAFLADVHGTDFAANAPLIAAAPELLRACEEALMVCDGHAAMNSREIITAAIAKAKGES